MSNCFDVEIIPSCFVPNDNTQGQTSIMTVIELNSDRSIHKTYYTDPETPNLKIDPATYLGGGVAFTGACQFNVSRTRETLCDDLNDVNAEPKKFVRTTTINYRMDGTASPQVVVDTEIDNTTLYAVVGNVIRCNDDCEILTPVGFVTT